MARPGVLAHLQPPPSLLLRVVCALLLLGFSSSACAVRDPFGGLRLPSEREREGGGEASGREREEDAIGERGRRWAVLVAGSFGYWNYRHQADVCHAYQVLSKNGLQEENIIVFMYDDIAFHEDNPRPGTIINSPNGVNVYKGVPKDYTGRDVRTSVFLNVLAGNKAAVRGIGSEKVLASGPSDHVFLFYSDHGGPGVLGMPNSQLLYADELNGVIKGMHEAGAFLEMVVYLEACESGSVFEGLLRPEWNVYATTASNAQESSWATYCPYSQLAPPQGFETCLGDLYSVAWIEDSETNDLTRETLLEQYLVVSNRTAHAEGFMIGSHVMQYGNMDIDLEKCSLYLGSNTELTTAAGASPSSTSLSPFVNNQDEEEQEEEEGKKTGIDLEKCSLYLSSNPELTTTGGGRSPSSSSLSLFVDNQNGEVEEEEEEGEKRMTHGERRSLYSINNKGGAVPLRDAELGSNNELATAAGAADKSASSLLSHFVTNQKTQEEEEEEEEEEDGREREKRLMGGKRRRSLYSMNKGGGAVPQRDAELVHYWAKLSNAVEGSARKAKALEELSRITSERAHIDRSVSLMGSLLFGEDGGDRFLNARRATGLPLVDDWNCLKAVVRAFEAHCGHLTAYGMRHMRRFANICNDRIPISRVEKAAAEACAD
ncbi:hypothetical protein CBR_g12919 [Chara braunii]|uniref:Legumain prodomain domain-containing protein n=1 Tax=Chara braunii TaxID=69332 RepID=A0A388KT10_CHABU|nr:hypothetical protein CBR_g12919 [Chara braunii]|eukprot:GBG73201.1 hypothetical protein CBR_g12919 [Chara braunii]